MGALREPNRRLPVLRAGAARVVLGRTPVRVPRPPSRQLLEKARRPILLGLKIVALVAILYEVAFNVFLMSGGLMHVLDGKADSLYVEYRAGWSIVPGIVHARDLRIRVKDSGIEFDLRIERCVFHAVLHELLARRFHVTHVAAHGLTFVSRFPVMPKDATGHLFEEIPMIEGIEEIPIRAPDTPPPDDAHYNLWTIALDEVDAEDVHEVWVHAFRFVGDARVVGGFYLKPTRLARVLPSTAFIRDGRVTAAGYAVADHPAGRIEATLDAFDPRVVGGIDVFHQAGGHVVLEGEIPSLQFADHWLEGTAVKVDGGAGHARLDGRVDHGRLASPTALDAAIDAFRLIQKDETTRSNQKDKTTATGDADLSVRVAAEEGKDTFEGELALRSVRLSLHGYESAPLRADRAAVRARAQDLDFTSHPLADASLAVRLPSLAVPDARAAQALLGEGGVKITGGEGEVQAKLDVVHGVGKGEATLALDQAGVVFGKDTGITGNLRARVDLRRWSYREGHADFSGSRVEALGVKAPGGTDDWWANIAFPSASLDTQGGARWRSQVVAEARDTRPFVATVTQSSAWPKWLVPLLTSNDLRVSAQVDAGPQGVSVRHGVATAGPLRAEATLSKKGGSTTGVAVLATGDLAVGVELREGGTHLELADAEEWYRQHAEASAAGR